MITSRDVWMAGGRTTTLPGAWRLYSRATAFAIGVLFAVGAAGHVIPEALPMMLFLTPGFSVLAGALALAPSVAAGGWRFTVWALAVYVATFSIDATGGASGVVFGEYVYGKTLGWAWHGVPLVISLNWVLVANGVTCIAGRMVPASPWRWRVPAVALLAGALAVAFDFVMEPVAVRLDYWTWVGGTVPWQNYLAWFALAGLAAALHPRQLFSACEMNTADRLAGIYVAMQVVFFIVLRAVWHFGAV